MGLEQVEQRAMASSMASLGLVPSGYSRNALGSIFPYARSNSGQNIGTSPGCYSLRIIHLSASLSNGGRKHRLPILVNSASNAEVPAGYPGVGDDTNGVGVKSPAYKQWDAMTSAIAASSNLAFILLQLPQIILNAQNLLSGNRAALFALPWLGQLTGLLGNLSLLSYFAKKKETEALAVQAVGVVSIYIVLTQLAMAGAMPVIPFIATSVAVASGLILNFLNYHNWLSEGIWRFWEDCITVGGLSVLPQVMWSTFVPYIPQSILPGTIAFIVAVTLVTLSRSGKLSKKAQGFVGSISGWTATLLFMWMPVAQVWTSYLNPDNIRGLSVHSILLAMIGNGLLIPRALFTRDVMWFTGSFWAALLYGWGNLLSMYIYRSISNTFFLSATAGLILWIGIILWRDAKAYGLSSPLTSLKELAFGPS